MIEPYYSEDGITLYCAKAEDVLPQIQNVSAVVTDPPYGLSFMGKHWDYDVPGVDLWRLVYETMRPGAHLLSFFGTRTYHRGVIQIEDAGFEIRDCIMWVYGSGFPKSLDVSKAIDKEAGVERRIIGKGRAGKNALGQDSGWNKTYDPDKFDITAPATEAAKKWNGWGTALKPAVEPIVVARKPIEGTVAENVLKYGTGGLNIDGCRVKTNGEQVDIHHTKGGSMFKPGKYQEQNRFKQNIGRWPANLIHDGSEEVVQCFPQSDTSRIEKPSDCDVDGATSFQAMRGNRPARGYNESGSAARFFYCAKASRSEREAGLEGMEKVEYRGTMGKFKENPGRTVQKGGGNPTKNSHPTVKPLALMKYLIKLVMPPGGILLDPFAGSGSTLIAAKELGFEAIGIEMVEDYCKIAVGRLRQQELSLMHTSA